MSGGDDKHDPLTCVASPQVIIIYLSRLTVGVKQRTSYKAVRHWFCVLYYIHVVNMYVLFHVLFRIADEILDPRAI